MGKHFFLVDTGRYVPRQLAEQRFIRTFGRAVFRIPFFILDKCLKGAGCANLLIVQMVFVKVFVPTNSENQIRLKKDLDRKVQFELLLDVLRSRDEWRTPLNLTIDDWRRVVELSIDQGLSAHLLERLEKHEKLLHPPAEIVRRLKAIGLRIAAANTKLYCELAVILQAMQKEAIPVIVLKGAHLAEIVYANVALRSMSDVDILVAKENITRVESMLFELGYVVLPPSMGTSHHHEIPFAKKDCPHIEVHHTLPFMGDIDKGVKEIWERAQHVTIAGCNTLVLSPEDLLVHVAVHASLLHRFGIGLKPLYDISAIVTHYHAMLDWEKVLSYTQHWGVGNAVYLTLRIANEMIDAGVPDRALQMMAPPQFDSALLDWPKELIFTAGLAHLWGAGWSKNSVTALFHIAFPRPVDIARRYGLTPTSLRLWLYYPVRWKELLVQRAGMIWRLVLRDKTVTAKAEMYQKLIDPPQRAR